MVASAQAASVLVKVMAFRCSCGFVSCVHFLCCQVCRLCVGAPGKHSTAGASGPFAAVRHRNPLLAQYGRAVQPVRIAHEPDHGVLEAAAHACSRCFGRWPSRPRSWTWCRRMGIEALAAEQAAGPGYKMLLASSISGRFTLLGGDEYWVQSAMQAEKNCWKSN